MTASKDTPDIQAIKTLIQAVFDSINASDPSGLKSHFFPSANLTIIRQDPPLAPSSCLSCSSIPNPPVGKQLPSAVDHEPKLTVLIRTNIETFVKMIEDGEKRRKGKPGPELHEAADLDATDVHVDALFGSAWTPFRVTFDGALHHYGTMVFTLGQVGTKDGAREWRIEGLTQSYRRTPGWEVNESFDAV